MKYAKTKSIIFTILSLALSTPAIAAENYSFDANHTNILWQVSHFGFSSPSGRFGIKSGKLMLDEKDLKNSSVEVTIDTNNLVTGLPKFDEHIKSPDFLDSAKYPTAIFKSTKVEQIDKNNAKVTGNLTLHGVTKPIVLNVKINKIGVQPIMKKRAAGFSATTNFKRSDFGIDKYVPNIADDVKVMIEAEAVMDK